MVAAGVAASNVSCGDTMIDAGALVAPPERPEDRGVTICTVIITVVVFDEDGDDDEVLS